MSEQLRRLPAVSTVLLEPEIASLLERLPRQVVVAAIQDAIAERRQAFADDGSGAPGGPAAGDEPPDALLKGIVDRASRLAAERSAPSLRQVVNATGVVLHTNLGRALLPQEAVAASAAAAGLPSNLEYSLALGVRGSRHDHLTERLKFLSGAEDGFAVNNNAAAVLLMLNTLAEGREVIVSRGELVEIGGSFRVPEIMRKSGAKLVEVGTTNRTHPDDYRRAIGPQTALLLKVHTSNYRIVGFTAEVRAADLAGLGLEHGIPLMYDLGSGALFDFAQAGLDGEPTLAQAVASGAAVVTASGDKLLGGPQAGIILGRRDLLQKARKNPLARALRLDKMTIAGLQATLDLYLRYGSQPAVLAGHVPTVRAVTRDPYDLQSEAEALCEQINALKIPGLRAGARPGHSETGGGSFPGRLLPTTLVTLACADVASVELSARMRQAAVPVIGRVEDGTYVIDPRTLAPGDASLVLAALRQALGGATTGGADC